MKTTKKLNKNELFNTVWGIMLILAGVLMLFGINPFLVIFLTTIIYPITEHFYKPN